MVGGVMRRARQCTAPPARDAERRQATDAPGKPLSPRSSEIRRELRIASPELSTVRNIMGRSADPDRPDHRLLRFATAGNGSIEQSLHRKRYVEI